MAVRLDSPFYFRGVSAWKRSQPPKERGIYAKTPSGEGDAPRFPACCPSARCRKQVISYTSNTKLDA